jgi:hypothetical protein
LRQRGAPSRVVNKRRDIAMEQPVGTARGKFKRMAEQMESTLKSVRYKADMAAKTVATIVKGILNGQHRP